MKYVIKNCSNLAVHKAHIWRLTHESQNIINERCWCQGIIIDIRDERKVIET